MSRWDDSTRKISTNKSVLTYAENEKKIVKRPPRKIRDKSTVRSLEIFDSVLLTSVYIYETLKDKIAEINSKTYIKIYFKRLPQIIMVYIISKNKMKTFVIITFENPRFKNKASFKKKFFYKQLIKQTAAVFDLCLTQKFFHSS